MTGLAFSGWESQAVRQVLHHMRPDDCEEIFAQKPHDDPDRLFAELVMVQPLMVFCEIAWPRGLLGRPAAFVAVAPSAWPCVGEAAMVATPEMDRRAFAVWRRRLRATLPGTCRAAGLHRLQCRSLATHRAAHAFLAGCGWQREGLERAAGREGQDFIRWAAIARDFPAATRPHHRAEKETA